MDHFFKAGWGRLARDGVAAVGLIAAAGMVPGSAHAATNLIFDPLLLPPTSGTAATRGDAWVPTTYSGPAGGTTWSLSGGTSADTCIMTDTPFCSNLQDWNGLTPSFGPSAPPNASNAFADPLDQTKHVTLSQTITGLTVNAQYTLSFSQAGFTLSNAASTPTVPEYWQVTFGTDVQNAATMNVDRTTVVDWTAQTMTFTAKAATETLSFLTKTASSTVSQFAALANVSLTQNTTSVPEPASLGLFGLGLAGLAALRRRAARKA